MTVEELAVRLRILVELSVLNPLLGNPADRLAWLAAKVDALLPGEGPLEHTFHSGEGQAEDIRWIGRNEQGIAMNSGAPYGFHGFISIHVTGLLLQGFEFENDEMDQVFQAMLLSDTELGSQ